VCFVVFFQSVGMPRAGGRGRGGGRARGRGRGRGRGGRGGRGRALTPAQIWADPHRGGHGYGGGTGVATGRGAPIVYDVDMGARRLLTSRFEGGGLSYNYVESRESRDIDATRMWLGEGAPLPGQQNQAQGGYYILVARLAGFPYGYTLQNYDWLNGLTVREIIAAVVANGFNVNQFYVSGRGIQVTRWYGLPYQGNRVVATWNNITLRNFCLGDANVDPAYLDDEDVGHSLAADNMMGFLEYMGTKDAYPYGGAGSGEAVNSFILYEGVTLTRTHPLPNAALQQRVQYRIAGFDQLIPWDVEGVLDTPVLSLSTVIPEYADVRFRIFIPGGQMNCVLKSAAWALGMHWVDDVNQRPDLLESHGSDGVRDELLFACAEAHIEEAFKEFKKMAVNARLQTNPVVIRERGYQQARAKFEREFYERTKHGFSPKLLKQFVKFLLENDMIYLNVVSLTEDGAHLVRSYMTNAELERKKPYTELCVVRVGLDGGVVCSAGESSSASSSSPLIHAVGVYPTPVFGDSREGIKRVITSSVFTEKLKGMVNGFVEMCTTDKLEGNSIAHLKQLVDEQNERHKESLLPFSKFMRKNYEEEGEDAMVVVEPVVDRYRMGIVVYDMETVENMRGIQDSSIVYEPLVKPVPTPGLIIPPTSDPNWYTVPEEQIPYVVQWGLLTDNEELPIDPKDVKLEFGDALLGKCVDDFLDSLKELCVSGRYKRLYAYAHNGAGFDAYMIKQFNTKYPVEDLLLTGRGLLSISVQLDKGSVVIFRDTRPFFSSSLHELCSVFAVPEKYRKTDFPITQIHARNCYNEGVLRAAGEYMVNDVVCLAYVVAGINKVIEGLNKFSSDRGCGSLLRKSNPKYGENVPPICQFVTVMSLVKCMQRSLFTEKYKIPSPLPVDIPALRKWITYANVGGRTTAYWRMFCCDHISYLLESGTTTATKEELKGVYKDMKERGDYCQVWDVTSLYPYGMFEYPMPTVTSEREPLKYLTPEECWQKVNALHCDTCADGWRLCYKHRCGGCEDLNNIGIAFIMVKNVRFAGSEMMIGRYFMNLVPRKLQKNMGLVYSYQSNEELFQQYKDGFSNPFSGSIPQFPEISCYTMYDIYWMGKCGFFFDMIGGVLFPTSYVFREQTHALFQQRIAAKKREKEMGLPKSMSTFYKLCYNGGYGINAQRDITDTLIVVDEAQATEEKLRGDRKLSPDEEIVYNTYTHQLKNNQWVIKKKKVPGACECYAPQSPCHIGAAVTAVSRHHMNLAMYKLAFNGHVGYTDTDSMAIHALGIDLHFKDTGAQVSGMYNESAEAPMGTYKNDHEGGKGEIIFLSFFIAKKVKVHFTLDAEGEIRIYPTFKGYNPSAVDYISGKRFSIMELHRKKVLALVDAYFDGEVKETTQTEFRRTLNQGVQIDREAKFSASFKSFTGASGKGTYLTRVPGASGGWIERVVPHGGGAMGVHKVEFPFFNKLEEEPHCPFENMVKPEDMEKRREVLRAKCGIDKEKVVKFVNGYYDHFLLLLEEEEKDLPFEDIFNEAGKILPSDYFWPNSSGCGGDGGNSEFPQEE